MSFDPLVARMNNGRRSERMGVALNAWDGLMTRNELLQKIQNS